MEAAFGLLMLICCAGTDAPDAALTAACTVTDDSLCVGVVKLVAMVGLKTAFNVCVPAASFVLVVNEAVLPETVTFEPIWVAPSKKLMVPGVGVPATCGVIFAVKVN